MLQKYLEQNIVMVVYAYNENSDSLSSSPWIYGVYKDHDEGFDKMREMEESEEYGHLIWSNNLIKMK